MATNTTAELLRRVRMVGRAGWLGGYTHYVVLTDGEALCWGCTHDNYQRISEATRSGSGDGWGAAGVDCVAGDDVETCAHCGKEIY